MQRKLFLTAAVVLAACAASCRLGVGVSGAGSTPEKIMREAMTAKMSAETSRLKAVHQFGKAQSFLNELRNSYPAWKPAIVSRKIDECERALAKLEGEQEERTAAKPDTTPAAAEVKPSSSSGAGSHAFIGHRVSKKLHKADCRWGEKISGENRVYFTSYDEAVNEGYIPCKICKPEQAAAVSAPVGTGGDTAAAASSPGEGYAASRKGKTFHRPDCEWAKRISPHNLVQYGTRDSAIAAGKKPCAVCTP